MENQNTLGYRLKLARMQSKLTQGDVAATLGYESNSQISTFENDGAIPNSDVLRQLALLYHKSADYLLDIPVEVITLSGLTEAQQKIMKELESEFQKNS